jgi:hypothetical protein
MDAKYEAFAEAWKDHVEPDAMRGFYYIACHFGPSTPVVAPAADEMTIEPDVPVSSVVKGYERLR